MARPFPRAIRPAQVPSDQDPDGKIGSLADEASDATNLVQITTDGEVAFTDLGMGLDREVRESARACSHGS